MVFNNKLDIWTRSGTFNSPILKQFTIICCLIAFVLYKDASRIYISYTQTGPLPYRLEVILLILQQSTLILKQLQVSKNGIQETSCHLD